MTAIDVKCPACHAEPGQRCRAGQSEQRVAHHVRSAVAARDSGRELTARERDQLLRWFGTTEKHGVRAVSKSERIRNALRENARRTDSEIAAELGVKRTLVWAMRKELGLVAARKPYAAERARAVRALEPALPVATVARLLGTTQSNVRYALTKDGTRPGRPSRDGLQRLILRMDPEDVRGLRVIAAQQKGVSVEDVAIGYLRAALQQRKRGARA